MRGLGPKRTRYAGAAFDLFDVRKRHKKGGGSAPPAIDPIALGEAQKNANIETAKVQSQLSNVNTTSPLGTSFFTPGANNQWNLEQKLTPELQAVLANQQRLAGTLPGVGNDISQLLFGPAAAGSVLAQNAARNFGPQVAARPDLQGKLDFSGFGALPTPNLQRGLDFSRLAPLSYNPADFDKQIKSAEGAAYRSQARFLDPQFEQQREDLRQQLADEGIPRGGEAFTRSTGDQGRQQILAYQQARDAAVAAGHQEQARLFGQQLAGRGQGAQEIAQAGAFANEAEQKRFGDILAARGVGTAEAQAMAAFRNQVAQQQWQNPLTALASLASTGSGLYGSAAQDLTTLSPLSGFEWAGSLPTFGGSPTAVSPANIVGAGQVGAQSAANRFAAGNTLNNQLFNGLGTLGGVANTALGGGATGGFLGSLFGPSATSGIAGAEAAALTDALAASAGALTAEGFPIAAAAAAPAAWIVCTELTCQGRMPKRHYAAGISLFAGYPERVKRGYYFWAVPAVRHLRRHPNSRTSKALAAIACWRSENIAAKRGVRGARRLIRGMIVSAIGYPICAAIGAVVGERDWPALYREEQGESA